MEPEEDHGRLVAKLALTLSEMAGSTALDPDATIRPPASLPPTRRGEGARGGSSSSAATSR